MSFAGSVALEWHERSSSWSAATRSSDPMGTIGLDLPGLALTLEASRPGRVVTIDAEPASPWTRALVVDPDQMEQGERAVVALRRDVCHLLWAYARLRADEGLERSEGTQVVYDVERMAVERALGAITDGQEMDWSTTVPPETELAASSRLLVANRADWPHRPLSTIDDPLCDAVIDIVRHLAEPPHETVIVKDEATGVRTTLAGAEMRVERIGPGTGAPGSGRARLVVACSRDQPIGMVLLRAHVDEVRGYVVGAQPPGEHASTTVTPVHAIDAQLDARDLAQDHLFRPGGEARPDDLAELARRWVAAGSPGSGAEALRRAAEVADRSLSTIWLHALAQAVEVPAPGESAAGLAVPGLGTFWRSHAMTVAVSEERRSTPFDLTGQPPPASAEMVSMADAR